MADSAHRSSFQIVFLQQSWDVLHLGYETDAAFAKLRSADWSKPLFVINVEDIESYRWSTQTIQLTIPATDRLVSALAPKAIVAEKKYGRKRSLESDMELLGHQVFGVFVSGKPIYYGVVLDSLSQMGIGWPVSRAEVIDGHAVMRLLPYQISGPSSVNYDNAAGTAQAKPKCEMCERIRDPRVAEIMVKAKVMSP
ncbi:MAG: hypothetical protein FWF41_03195 [Betaproteobacteria bacterium]|nr:hypothetical protein [Betaproteobacteria bacterium]